jgi:hypothetical protein
MARFGDSTQPPLEDGLEKPPQSSASQQRVTGGPPIERKSAEGDDDIDLLRDKDWTAWFKESLRVSSDYMQQTLRPGWSKAYRAFGNRHVDGSKYDTTRYRNRNKLFVPKTRMAVRKNDASAASALFSTADVMSIAPENESDPEQVMTARFIAAAVNYRLDRSTRMTGPGWFMTAIGSRQDAQLTGICASKQYWQYEERVSEEIVTETDPVTGQKTERIQKKSTVIADRPMVDLIPAEHVFADPTADWRDPVQSGGYWFVAYPVRLNDLETMVEDNVARPRMGGGRWRKVNVRELTKGRTAEARRQDAVRRAREQGQDRYESRFADKRGDVIWLYDCYYRYNGEDWNWWMLGETMMLSDPQPTRYAYPEQEGDRPYTMGVGSLETHKVYPMGPVESWQPLQQQANEITNLTLDALKMSISPITKIVRGRNVDTKQVQARGPDAMVFVDKPEDVTFEKAPGPGGEQAQQQSLLNVAFDELSGSFSTGSVQTNRQLNETVGGMQLMAGSSNALTEFDLRVWAETWAEPCIRQVCRLVQFYEASEKIIKIAGQKAGLIMAPSVAPREPGPLEQKPSPTTPPLALSKALDLMPSAAISVRVNIGLGSMDPRQKLEKFGMGLKFTMELGPLMDKQGFVPNAAELMNEAWGILGYKDPARFVMPKPKEGDQPPPEMMKLMMEIQLAQQKAQLDQQAKQQDMANKQEEHRLKMMELMAELQAQRQELMMKFQEMQMEMHATRQKQQLDLRSKVIEGEVQRGQSERDHQQQTRHADEQHSMALRHGEAQTNQKIGAAEATTEQKLTAAEQTAQQKLKAMKAQNAVKPKPAGKPKGKGKGR